MFPRCPFSLPPIANPGDAHGKTLDCRSGRGSQTAIVRLPLGVYPLRRVRRGGNSGREGTHYVSLQWIGFSSHLIEFSCDWAVLEEEGVERTVPGPQPIYGLQGSGQPSI